ncbi:MAG: hypothetical protein JEZ03_01355 [Bacteroidales bacterium]|nr:hypothetical protein [Bacteroidales bacterium]
MKNILLFVSMIMLMASCTSTYDSLKEEIARQEKNLFEDHSGVADQKLAKEMNEAYLSFADQFPNDSLSPEYLFRAAEIDANVLGAKQAIQYYDRILDNYSNYPKMPEALFMKAFIYDRDFQNVKLSEKYYSLFVKKFPDHPLANDAKLSIQHLGMSDVDIIKMFQQKNSTTN